MAHARRIRRRTAKAALLTLTLLLAACGAAPPPAAQAPPPAPTAAQAVTAPASATDAPASATPAAPTVAAETPSPTNMPPTATSAAEPPTPTAAAPTATPAAGLLPAPVYLLTGTPNQIVRLERDGSTLAPVTFEERAVSDFDVAGDAGAIVYVTGDEQRSTLVILDGGGRRELFSGELSAPRISPDGRRVVAHIDSANPRPGVGLKTMRPGVWSLPAAGGPPELLIADDSAESQESPDGVLWVYTPISYDQAGQRLLLWAYNQAGPAIPGGELVVIGQGGKPVSRTATCCEGAAWSVDGTALTIVGGGPGPDVRYGLYQIAADAGGEKPVIEQGDRGVPLVTGARQLLDGAIYAFYQQVATDVFSWDSPFTPQMVRVAGSGKITPLRQDNHLIGEVIWRNDASGALITTPEGQSGDAASYRLVWLDSGGGPAAATRAEGSHLHWADTVRPLYEGDCTLLPQIAWQPPSARGFSAGALDLQRRLSASGQDVGKPDGYFGDQTRAALHRFQVSRGLPPSDALDCVTWQALLGRA